MAPVQPRKLVAKERFQTLFATLKTQSYYDPSSRGPGSHAIRTIAWNPQGSLIATGSANKTLRVWNPEKADVKYSTELRGHTGPIEQVAWNPTKEAELASVSMDGTCKFWDVRTKTCLATVPLGSDGLSLSWAPDGGMVFAGSRKDETLTPISVPSFVAHTPMPQISQTNRTVFAPTSAEVDYYTILISMGSGAVRFCRYPKDTSSSTSADGDGDVDVDNERNTNNWVAPKLRILETLQAHTSSCMALKLAPTGRYLATGGSDAMLNLWDTQDLVCVRGLDRAVGGVKNLSFSWDGHFIVGGSDEGNGLDVAHVESGEYVHRIETTAPAPCVAWHPTRYWLAYASDPGGLKIVGAAGGQL